MKKQLPSFPPVVRLSIPGPCKARCVFCLGGNRRSPPPDQAGPVCNPDLLRSLSRAGIIQVWGPGELLDLPRFPRFLRTLSASCPDTAIHLSTHGAKISPGLWKLFTTGRYAVGVALNAADARAHKHITGRDTFNAVVRTLSRLCFLRDTANPGLSVRILFLAMRQNIASLPDVVRIAARCGVRTVAVDYVSVRRPHHLPLSCFHDQRACVESFATARLAAAKTGITLSLPPVFGARHTGPGECPLTRSFVRIEPQGTILPCSEGAPCVGNINRGRLETFWKGTAFQRLRSRTLAPGPRSACRFCMQRDPGMVNDIRAHISHVPADLPWTAPLASARARAGDHG